MTTLSSIIPPVSLSTASGTLPASSGGTGLTSPGTAGNVLISDGTGWTSGAAATAYPQNIQSGNYTLVLGDAGKQIYSANTGAQTITIPTNASVAFPLGTLITIVNMGTNSILLSVAGVSVFNNGNASAFSSPLVPPANSVQILKTGTNSWNATFGTFVAPTFTYLMVAGGGSGGSSNGGGGGAGGYLTGTASQSGTLTITVGAGGTGGSTVSTNGTNSSISSIGTAAVGGGYGGNIYNTTIGAVGGSGGGGRGSSVGGAGTAGQGFAGGTAYSGYGGGGGGGASAAGVNGDFYAGGKGGDGLSSSITGTAVTRGGGGGGGGGYYSTATSLGGAGGGGAGYGGNLADGTTNAGVANTGGGGGGCNSPAQQGGSGVVILSCPVAATSTTGSPTITTVGSNTVYVFNSSGTITF